MKQITRSFDLNITPLIVLLATIVILTIMVIREIKSLNNTFIPYEMLDKRISEIKTDVDVLKGQMKAYQDTPLDLRARIEVIEMRMDNLMFFQKDLKDGNASESN